MINKNFTLMFTPKFTESLDKLSDNYRKLTLKKIKFLAMDPRYSSLRTQKNGDVFESSATMDIRIIWQFDPVDSSVIVLLDVGHHDILNRL